MRRIARIRRLLSTPTQISIVWLIVGTFLLAWFVVWDSYHIGDPIGYYYIGSYLALLVPRQALIWLLKGVAEKIARKRLRAAAPHYQRANTYLEHFEFDKAAGEYVSIFNIDPDNARAYMGRGRVHGMEGQYDLAIASYTAAIKMDPFIRGLAHRNNLGNDAGNYDLAWAYYYRGRAHLSEGEFDLAGKDFKSAVSVGSTGFPKAVGNAGFLTALSNSNPPPEQRAGSGNAGTVHYVKPCGAVRMNEGLDCLYARYYLAVTCPVCLENIPETNQLRKSLGSPLSRIIFPWAVLASPLGWSFLGDIEIHIFEGQIFPWLILYLLFPIGVSPLWSDVILESFMAMARPLASRFLARPFHGGS